jgi:hypothetical protein
LAKWRTRSVDWVFRKTEGDENKWMIVIDAVCKKDYRFTMVFVAPATMNYSWCFGKDNSSDSQLNNGDWSVTARKGLAS